MKHFNLFLRKYKKFLVWKTIFYGNYKQLVFSLKNFFREGQVIGSFKWTSKKFSFRKLVFLRESIIFFFGLEKIFGQNFFCLSAPGCCIVNYFQHYPVVVWKRCEPELSII